MKGTALNRFILQRTGKNWDDFPITGVKIEDLSANALNRFRREAAKSNRVDADILNDTTEHLLYDLRLIDDDTKQLSRAAVLLFHPDHVVFWNAGRLPEEWTTQKLFEKHPSRPYNPSIANALFRCGDIESWGRGYKRILEAVSTYKLLPPKLEMLSGLMITYYTDVRSQLIAQRLDERFIPVIEYVAKHGSITNLEVQTILNTNRSSAYRILQQLGDWLEMQGVTGKSTYYTIKGFSNASQTLHIKRVRLKSFTKKGYPHGHPFSFQY